MQSCRIAGIAITAGAFPKPPGVPGGMYGKKGAGKTGCKNNSSRKNPFLKEMTAPLCASPAPKGGGGVSDATVVPVQKFPVFFVYR